MNYPPPMGYGAPMRPPVAAPYVTSYSAPPVAYPPMPYPPMPMAPMPYPGMPMPYPFPVTPGLPLPTPGAPMQRPPQVPVPTGTIVKAPAAATSQGQKHTTVYVGKIAPSVEDEFLRLLLQQCGTVSSWKRVTDPITNQARAFGFCTYENAEGVLRALRILNNFELDERPLLVKVDDNTQQYLDGYEREKRLLEEKRKAHLAETSNGDAKREPTMEEVDDQVKAKINTLVAERKTGVFFEKYFMNDGDAQVIPVAEGEVVAGHEIDKQKAVVVAQEIKNFRVRQAKRDKEKKELDDDKSENSRNASREFEREQRERERERIRIREQRARDREREARRRDREKREFIERERDWIAREKEKERERERREREDERERERQIERELNYDEEEDKKMRKAGRRKRAREREELDDQEDRNTEREAERLRQERELELLRQQQEEEERRRLEEERRREEEEERKRPLQRIDLFADYEDDSRSDSMDSIDQRINQAKRLGFGFAADTKKLPKITPGFVPDEEPNPLLVPKKKKLVPLDPMKSEEQLKREREEEAKAIVKLIPTGKDELFVFAMDWDIIDSAGIVPKRMKPWVTKKIVEYLGEEEQTLIDFIVSKMAGHMAPQEILGQLVFVLEDEAEVFVIKLWRMLIFEMIRAQRDKEREEQK